MDVVVCELVAVAGILSAIFGLQKVAIVQLIYQDRVRDKMSARSADHTKKTIYGSTRVWAVLSPKPQPDAYLGHGDAPKPLV